ncbi:MAG: peptidylprolyl isomerase [Planctomycetota bacterium]
MVRLVRRWAVFAFLAFVVVASGCSPSGSSTDGGHGGSPATASIPGGGQDSLHPVVVLETSKGAITVRLDAEKAPLTVENFLAYVQSGHYDQTIFQVFPGQAIVGGGYNADLTEKLALTPIRNEAHNGLKNARGTIAMVRSPDAIDSARSQFFINLADNTAFDHKDRTTEGYGYCVFGQVVTGLDVADRIAAVPVHDTPECLSVPEETILLKSAKRTQ